MTCVHESNLFDKDLTLLSLIKLLSLIMLLLMILIKNSFYIGDGDFTFVQQSKKLLVTIQFLVKQ